ncbi:MAG: hypothetical protein NVSMB9_12700 [Isosphaeraceae bacterium]
MAKKKAAKPETKSDFLRNVLGKKPELDLHQINRLWTKSGHAGEISAGLYYQIRSRLGIKSEWRWVHVSELEPKEASRRAHKSEATPAQPASSQTTGPVYQFKITLLGTAPPVWRRIQVRDCTLDMLHDHIQMAMGWTNSHMHQFTIGKRFHMDPMLMGENFDEVSDADSTTTRLSEILPRNSRRFKFEYEYDFGDSWQHEILFEGSTPADPKQRYPLCLDGARACPPEDCGGVWGYADFLEAIADPEHERHEDMTEWIGGKFDPETFDPSVATRRMKKGLPDWR